MNATLKLFLSGDVMPGRGIDQVLPRSCSPRLYERYAKDAWRYVELAEKKNGPIPKPLSYRALWGDVLEILDQAAPDLRIINLETSITRSEDHDRNKGIHYRMHPANAAFLTVARVDCCSLANNHTLDWGRPGLIETLATLHTAGVVTAGAGADVAEATQPAILTAPGKPRVIVAAAGCASSGIAPDWAADVRNPGLNRLSEDPQHAAEQLLTQIRSVRAPGDRVIASLHWGDNWGYDIPDEQVTLAHALIDSGEVDIVHGHSSHHVKALEIYRDKLILYGCGDLLTDYEGIRGHEAYRGDIGVIYLPEIDTQTGALRALTLIPTTLWRFQIRRATGDDTRWLMETLTRECAPFGVRFRHVDSHTLRLCG